MNLAEIFEEEPDEIVGVRPLRVPRELDALPGIQMRIKLALQFINFAANALDFARRLIGRICEAAQLDDVPLERIDRVLPLLFRFLRFPRPSGQEPAGWTDFTGCTLFPFFSCNARCLASSFRRRSLSRASCRVGLHWTTATESAPQMSRTRSTSSLSAWTALEASSVASEPSSFTSSNVTRQWPGRLVKRS